MEKGERPEDAGDRVRWRQLIGCGHSWRPNKGEDDSVWCKVRPAQLSARVESRLRLVCFWGFSSRGGQGAFQEEPGASRPQTCFWLERWHEARGELGEPPPRRGSCVQLIAVGSKPVNKSPFRGHLHRINKEFKRLNETEQGIRTQVCQQRGRKWELLMGTF